MSDMSKGMRPNLYDLLQGGGGGGGDWDEQRIETIEHNLGTVESEVDTLNDTTIPAINTRIDTAQSAADGAAEQAEILATETIPGINAQIHTIDTRVNTLNNTTIPAINTRIDTAQSAADGAAEQAEILATETIPGINSQIHTINYITIPAINTRIDTITNTTIPNIETWISEVEGTVENIQLVDIPRIEDAGNQNTAAINTINNTTVPAINTRIDGVEAALSRLLKVANMTLDDITVNAGARKNNVFTDIAPSGYTIVGVKLINIQDATTGGTGRDKVFLSSWSTTGGSTSLQIAVYNSANTAAKIKISVDVLCMKGA